MPGPVYLYQLIERVFGPDAEKWLDTPNPDFAGKPKPRDLVECRECRELVLTYLENMSTEAAVVRTTAKQTVRHNADYLIHRAEEALKLPPHFLVPLVPELISELKAALADNDRLRADMQRSLDTRIIAGDGQ